MSNKPHPPLPPQTRYNTHELYHGGISGTLFIFAWCEAIELYGRNDLIKCRRKLRHILKELQDRKYQQYDAEDTLLRTVNQTCETHLWFNIGMINALHGEHYHAAWFFRKAKRTDRSLVLTRYALGVCLYGAKMYRQATEVFKRVLQIMGQQGIDVVYTEVVDWDKTKLDELYPHGTKLYQTRKMALHRVRVHWNFQLSHMYHLYTINSPLMPKRPFDGKRGLNGLSAGILLPPPVELLEMYNGFFPTVALLSDSQKPAAESNEERIDPEEADMLLHEMPGMKIPNKALSESSDDESDGPTAADVPSPLDIKRVMRSRAERRSEEHVTRTVVSRRLAQMGSISDAESEDSQDSSISTVPPNQEFFKFQAQMGSRAAAMHNDAAVNASTADNWERYGSDRERLENDRRSESTDNEEKAYQDEDDISYPTTVNILQGQITHSLIHRFQAFTATNLLLSPQRHTAPLPIIHSSSPLPQPRQRAQSFSTIFPFARASPWRPRTSTPAELGAIIDLYFAVDIREIETSNYDGSPVESGEATWENCVELVGAAGGDVGPGGDASGMLMISPRSEDENGINWMRILEESSGEMHNQVRGAYHEGG